MPELVHRMQIHRIPLPIATLLVFGTIFPTHKMPLRTEMRATQNLHTGNERFTEKCTSAITNDYKAHFSG